MKFIWINTILMVIFIITGYLAMIVVFHETWHMIQHGKPVGVCVGWLDANGGKALAGTIFNPNLPLDMKEEQQVWIFGIIISSLLLGIFLFTQVKIMRGK